MANMHLYELCAVGRTYREGTAAAVHALADVSLTIAAGSFTAITGPSGSGKTTLLALLGALERPSRGQVLFQGRDLGQCSGMELARVRRRLGFVFQDNALIPTLPVWENITYPLVPQGVSRIERRNRARELLHRFGLEDKWRARPGELSGGEQQRVAIARALAAQPEIVLADEPTSNLDPAAGETVLAWLREMHAEGTTVIVASHDPRTLALATHVFVLEAGRSNPPIERR